MKKILLPVFFIGINILQAQIPNSDFELWDNQPVPLLWETNSRPLTLPPFNPYIVVKDTDHYTGSFSANLIGNGAFHSWAKTTFPLTQHPASLTLYYKLNFPPCVNDSGYFEQDTVSVLTEILNNSSVVDSGYWSFTGGSNMLWTQLTIPFSNNSSAFDSCRITITGGKIFGGCGFAAAATEFKVDHLSMNYQSTCAHTGIVRDGVEGGCLLIDTGTASWLLPCNVGLGSLGFSAGDTIHFSYIANPTCITTCQQGTTVDLTCVDTSNVHPLCNLSVSLNIHHPTSSVATNGTIQSVVINGTPPLYFAWNPTVGNTDSISGLGEGVYCVTVSDANNCTAMACDSLAGAHVCIDSSLICDPGSLCCDAPLEDHVCGCDSVTYTNGCIATQWHGVTSYYHGDCVVTGIKNISDTETGIFVSPVPAKDMLTVNYVLRHSGKTEIKITNLLGQTSKLVQRGFEISGTYKAELSANDLARGVYFVEVKNEFERKFKKFIVE